MAPVLVTAALLVAALVLCVLATMLLFYAVSYWNSWFAGFLYMDRQELFPVTVFLRNLIAGRDWARVDFNIGKLIEPAGD